jgi:acyl carrier protein
MDERFTTLVGRHLRFLPEDGNLAPNSRLRELGLDSMHAIELVFAIEDEYGVTVPDELLNDRTFETAGSLRDALSTIEEGTA